MLNILPPRSFADLTVPTRADGTPIERCRKPEDYQTYVNWLADYLHTTELQPTATQQTWLTKHSKTPDMVIFQCSDAYGYALDDLAGIEQAFQDHETWAQYRDRMRALWTDEPCQDEQTFEEWLAVDEPTFDRLHAEWTEMSRTANMPNHTDIPFRPLLAWALHRIPERTERIRQVDWFFRNFADNASK